MSKMRFFALQELSNRKPLEVIAPSNKLSDYYGSHVFDRKKMQEYLPKEAYKAVTDAIEKGTPISLSLIHILEEGTVFKVRLLPVLHFYDNMLPCIGSAIYIIDKSSFCFYFRLLFVVKELNVGNYMLSYEQIIQEVN